MLLRDSEYITERMHKSIQPGILEIIKILTASINTAKEKV